MVINEERPIMISEVYSLLRNSESDLELKKFIEKFGKPTPEKDVELKKSLENLNLLKLKDRHIVKIVDFKPKTAVELNKIIFDVSLDNEETTKILKIIKNE